MAENPRHTEQPTTVISLRVSPKEAARIEAAAAKAGLSRSRYLRHRLDLRTRWSATPTPATPTTGGGYGYCGEWRTS